MESPVLVETELPDGLKRWALPGVAEPRSLTPPEKIALERHLAVLNKQAELRQSTCWQCGSHRVNRWVHEVGFDFKNERAKVGPHTAISSADYPGPVPGFCPSCWDGPRQLALVVFQDRPEIAFGARPTRWFVRLTDGTLVAGEIAQLAPAPPAPVTG